MEGRHDRDKPLEEEPKGGLPPDPPEDLPIVILPDQVDLIPIERKAEPPAKPRAVPPPPRPAPQLPPTPPPARRSFPVAPKPIPAAVRARIPTKVAGRPKSRLRAATAWLAAAGVLIASVAGFLVIRQGFVARHFPMPGPLSSAHTRVEDFARTPDCRLCHRDEGITAGCLSCHEEIAGQLAEGRGLHPFLFLLTVQGADRNCFSCHQEHQGSQYELAGALAWMGLDPERFQHPHLAGFLLGKHLTLPCAECHEKKVARRFSLPAFPALERERSFLGLAQTCGSCHADPHAHGLSGKCDDCHGQESFRGPGPFDHGEHLALAGAHAGIPCGRCHRIPESDRIPADAPEGFPFAGALGKACGDCHKSPHRTTFSQDCPVCHGIQDPSWSAGAMGMTLALHEETGFSLRIPHTSVDCGKCHDPALPYTSRYPDPAKSAEPRTQDRCQSCHRDVHGGQFLARGQVCLDCHTREAFQPSRFDREAHARVFPLADGHQAVECLSCHKEDPKTGVRAYVGLPRDCQGCHTDPHRGQFARDGQTACADCHGTRAFAPALFDRERHEPVFALQGLHRTVDCVSCHRVEEGTGMRIFKGLPRDCQGCHADPHQDQFARSGQTDCTGCHGMQGFLPALFGQERHEQVFALQGLHRAVACVFCHHLEEGTKMRVFKGLPHECKGCHADPHGGQFGKELRTGDCTACHSPRSDTFSIPGYDHAARTGYALIGSHAKAGCRQCHRVEAPRTPPPGAALPPAAVRVYRGTSQACGSCHIDIHRGQFRRKGVTPCEDCHASQEDWKLLKFDHNRQARFALDGIHTEVPCGKCHPQVRLKDRSLLTQYRPLGTQCKDCHEISAH